jgi:uncharacterized repeat protein (TIGR02543 family)
MPSILASAAPTRTGYTFDGYYDTDSETGGTRYYTAGMASERNWDKTSGITLYARWIIITNTISFSANNGSDGQTAQVTATYGMAMPSLSASAPTRTGYTFGGYYDTSSATGGTQYYTAEMTSARTWNKTNDTTLYARWTVSTSTVSFDANGGSGGQTANVTATYGSSMPSILASAAPTRTGYTFGGYYDTNEATGGTQYYTAAMASARTWNKEIDTTLYARWTGIQYTISFNANGGSGGPASTTATFGAALPEVSIMPTRTNYYFLGYFNDTAGTTEYYGADLARTKDAWDIAANTTLYARWSSIPTHSITFHSNNGNNQTATQSIPENTSAALRANTFTRSGYTFAGWSTEPGGTVAYENAASYSAGAGQATVNLYAVWTGNQYTVSLNAYGGSGGTASVTATYGSPMPTLSVSAPVRAGYTFLGYYNTNAQTGGTQYYTAEMESVRNWDYAYNNSLFARWVVNTYVVSFNVNGGNGGQTEQVTATYDSSMPSLSNSAPTRTGYIFVGYYDTSEATGGTQYYTSSMTSSRSWDKENNTTLYARWMARTYTVSFRVNGGSGGQTSYLTATYDSPMPSLSVSAPERTGYTFGGYYDTDAATGGTQYYTADMQSAIIWEGTSNVTLYARWIIITNTISFNVNGGSGGQTADVTATYGIAMPAISTTAPTRTGYTFDGYYDAETGGTRYYTAAMASARTWNQTGDTILYARWNIINYNITFNANGYGVSGGQTAAVTVNYGSPMPVITASAPTRTGFIFDGYYDTSEATGGTQYYTVAMTSERLWDKTSNTTLYARWIYNGPFLFTVSSADDWNEAVNIIKNGGNNTESEITVNGNIGLPGNIISFNPSGNITVTLKGNGRLSNLFLRIYNTQTIIIDSENLILEGNNQYNTSTIPVMQVYGNVLELKNGKIINNKNAYYGGAVIVSAGQFIMTGGEISGNTASAGGGVYVSGGTFTMKGGKISGNTGQSPSDSGTGNGGGVYVNGGNFNMEGGEISGNTTVANGGGVYIQNSGTFTMTGGKISGNTVTSNDFGGGVCVDRTTFIMNNGEISGNTSAGSGGGVSVTFGGTFTMTGGRISGNTAGGGGGVSLYTLGPYSGYSENNFSKTGGIIYGNDAGDDSNTTVSGSSSSGNAVYWSGQSSNRYRNTTLGEDDDISTGVTTSPPWNQ